MDKERNIVNYTNVRMWISLALFPCNFVGNKARLSGFTIDGETYRESRLPYRVALVD